MSLDRSFWTANLLISSSYYQAFAYRTLVREREAA